MKDFGSSPLSSSLVSFLNFSRQQKAMMNTPPLITSLLPRSRSLGFGESPLDQFQCSGFASNHRVCCYTTVCRHTLFSRSVVHVVGIGTKFVFIWRLRYQIIRLWLISLGYICMLNSFFDLIIVCFNISLNQNNLDLPFFWLYVNSFLRYTRINIWRSVFCVCPIEPPK